jgi:hypothetical protein
LEDVDVDWSIILKWTLKELTGWLWTGLMWAQDRDKWRTVLKMVMIIGFHKMRNIYLLAEEVLGSQ